MQQQFNKTYKLDEGIIAPASEMSPLISPLYPGSYTVSITGEQLDDLQVTCNHSFGMITPSDLAFTNGMLTFRLEAADLLHDLQISLQNDGAHPAVLESFHLQKDSGR